MISKARLGMWLFVGSETVFFVMFILAFLYFHRSVRGPDSVRVLEPGKAAAFTGFLLASSVTCWRAHAAARRASMPSVAGWLAATIVLGAVFVLGQAAEWTRLIQKDVTISRDLFGTTFFTLTGFHGLHVCIGLVMLAVVLGFALAGDFRTRPRFAETAVDIVAIYWHFVDVVWIVIFSILYMWAAP